MFIVPVLIALVILSFSSISFFILWRISNNRFIDNKTRSDIDNLVLSSAIGGYYYFDAEEKSEYFSLNLLKVFDLNRSIKSFDQIAKLFKYDKDDLLGQLNSLKEGGTVNFLLTCKATLLKEEKYFQCSGNRVDDDKGNIVGVIIWFIDISEYILELKKLTDENIEANEEIESYKNILNALPMPVWQRSDDFNINYSNVIYNKYVDYEGKGKEKPELDEQVRKKSKKFIDKNDNKIFNTKKHIVVEGQRCLFDISEIPLEDKSVVGFAYDISKEEDIEKELDRHISAHADLLESSSSAMAIYSRDTNLKFYNNSFVKLWELDEKWLDSNPGYGEVLEMLREKRKLPEQANFKKFRESQIKMFKELIKPHNEFFYLPDGRALRVIVIPHALGGLLFAYEDMTDRLAIESSYNTLMAVQKETFDNLREGILVIGEDGRVKLSNPMFNTLWPQTTNLMNDDPHFNDIIERSKDLLNFNEDWEEFKAKITAELTHRSSGYRRIERTDDKVIDIVSVPLPDGANLISFVDVTAATLVERSLRETNEALAEADRIKTEFLANVSYELRTPLTTIMGFAETLEGGFLGHLSEKQQSYIHDIYDSASELMSLINDILDLSSIEAGYMTLELKEFDVYKMLSSIVKLLKERCREVGINISLDCPNDIGKMNGDERRIKQVMFNILSNSLKFTLSGGKIIVGAARGDDKSVNIWVSDTGIGIKEEDHDKIFNRFFKSSDAIDKNVSGTGLGLSVVEKITQLHGGDVVVESKYGKGTKVICSFNDEQLK